MSIFIQVIKDLVKMFVADVRMTTAILALVALVATLVKWTNYDSLTIGWLLPAGCVILLITSAVSAAAKNKK